MDVGLVFGIIFAIILIGAVFVYGFDLIKGFFCTGSDAQTLKAVKDLEVSVKDLYALSEGSTLPFKLHLPGDAKICFINPDDLSPNIPKGWNPDSTLMELLNTSGTSFYRSNLWIEKCSEKIGYKIPHLLPAYNFCATQGDELFLENKGYWVEVSLI